jgi:DNA polymerase-3 subunit delta
MTPEQFIDQLPKKGPPPVCLFIGPESFNRDRVRRALLETVLAPEERESGFSRHDLDDIPLAAALDDARSLSLFSANRVLWLDRAEVVLPRAKSAAADEETESGDEDDALKAYLKSPTPGVVVVLDCARYDFDGEDRAKLERVQKFFSYIPVQVEFKPFAPEASRALAQSLAKQAGLQLPLSELALLLEATGGEALRLAVEIEKLRLYVGTTRKVTADDILSLVPDAQAANIFALVAAMGRGDRKRALQLLDALARDGEYMPLALTFLGTQFRMALAAREAGARSAGGIQTHFNKMGARIWAERARQIEQTVEAFPKGKLEQAVQKVFEADRSLRDARPDDRIVMEEMILELTSKR